MSRNILFIMCDQLRHDYLGCSGHETIRTPNIDNLARTGVRFDHAYVQSPICGPSRMSFYTGRYVRSHGSTWNGAPLRIGEMTLGEHLSPLGLRTVLCGKTHFVPDISGMRRFGIDRESELGAVLSEGGFERWDRLEGIHPAIRGNDPANYQSYLAKSGYEGDHLWEKWVNSVEDENGATLSGWLMSNADRPARVREEDSETPYIVGRAIDYMRQASEQWCIHLSLIKPHWPYIAPAPYNSMYGPQDVAPVVRSEAERIHGHPVLKAFQDHRVSRSFSRDEVRQRVIPAYMGLITQIDDQIGRLTKFLESSGLLRETLIVFTSDHGDYLGDHWLGEKELFHDPSVRVPLIVVDPSRQGDVRRGTVCSELVEAIDLLPTFIDFAGGAIPDHIVEGKSLMPLIRQYEGWRARSVAISEYDYSYRKARKTLGQPISECRLIMAFDGRFKLVKAQGFRCMLFDLDADPTELCDLGEHAEYEAVCERLLNQIFEWSLKHHNRTTTSDEYIENDSGQEFFDGVLIGFWDEDEYRDALSRGDGGN